MLADDKVQKLIAEVQKRKGEIGKIESQTFKTNCQYQGWSDKVINLQVVSDVNQLINILAELTMRGDFFKFVCEENKWKNVFQWQGYSYEDWANDIRNRINKLSLSAKRKDLETLEARLDKLVSPELKAKMELELIEKELGL